MQTVRRAGSSPREKAKTVTPQHSNLSRRREPWKNTYTRSIDCPALSLTTFVRVEWTIQYGSAKFMWISAIGCSVSVKFHPSTTIDPISRSLFQLNHTYGLPHESLKPGAGRLCTNSESTMITINVVSCKLTIKRNYVMDSEGTDENAYSRVQYSIPFADIVNGPNTASHLVPIETSSANKLYQDVSSASITRSTLILVSVCSRIYATPCSHQRRSAFGKEFEYQVHAPLPRMGDRGLLKPQDPTLASTLAPVQKTILPSVARWLRN